jgi:hypothetical protein
VRARRSHNIKNVVNDNCALETECYKPLRGKYLKYLKGSSTKLGMLAVIWLPSSRFVFSPNHNVKLDAQSYNFASFVWVSYWVFTSRRRTVFASELEEAMAVA